MDPPEHDMPAVPPRPRKAQPPMPAVPARPRKSAAPADPPVQQNEPDSLPQSSPHDSDPAPTSTEPARRNSTGFLDAGSLSSEPRPLVPARPRRAKTEQDNAQEIRKADTQSETGEQREPVAPIGEEPEENPGIDSATHEGQDEHEDLSEQTNSIGLEDLAGSEADSDKENQEIGADEETKTSAPHSPVPQSTESDEEIPAITEEAIPTESDQPQNPVQSKDPEATDVPAKEEKTEPTSTPLADSDVPLSKPEIPDDSHLLKARTENERLQSPEESGLAEEPPAKEPYPEEPSAVESGSIEKQPDAPESEKKTPAIPKRPSRASGPSASEAHASNVAPESTESPAGARKAPPPKPKKLSSRIAAFQQMFNEPAPAPQPRSASPERGKLSSKRTDFAASLQTVMGRGLPLPGMADPAMIKKLTRLAEEPEIKDTEKTDEGLAPSVPRRTKGPKKRLPKLVQETKLEVAPRFQVLVSTQWVLRLPEAAEGESEAAEEVNSELGELGLSEVTGEEPGVDKVEQAPVAEEAGDDQLDNAPVAEDVKVDDLPVAGLTESVESPDIVEEISTESAETPETHEAAERSESIQESPAQTSELIQESPAGSPDTFQEALESPTGEVSNLEEGTTPHPEPAATTEASDEAEEVEAEEAREDEGLPSTLDALDA